MEKNDLDKFIERSDAFDTRKLLEGVDLSNAAEEIDLEEILAEYGKRGHLKDLPEAESDEVWVNEGYRLKPVHVREEKAAPQEDETPPGAAAEEQRRTRANASAPPEPQALAQTGWDPEPQALYEPEAKADSERARGVPLEDVMAQVVDAVMEDEESRRQVAQPVVRRGLFSRKLRRFEDTEPVYVPPETEIASDEGESYVEEPEEEDDFGDLPERDSGEASADYHRR